VASDEENEDELLEEVIFAICRSMSSRKRPFVVASSDEDIDQGPSIESKDLYLDGC